jgi:hypothetical protein
MKKSHLSILIVFNVLVLLGQLWPDGAPPFARVINIITLFVNVVVFGMYAQKAKQER